MNPRSREIELHRMKKRLVKRFPISGVYFDTYTGRYKWYTFHNKKLRKICNKKVRQFVLDGVGDYSWYRKVYDYKYEAY